MDSSRDETNRSPAVQMHSFREFEQHLNDLKKENFSLKLRIYFLEEKIQQKFEESSNEVHRRNIELKVEVESLKKELEEKQELLDKALSTAEALSNQNEAQLLRRLAEQQQDVSRVQEVLETKVQLLEKEAELARDQAHRMAQLADSEARRRLVLEREMEERMEEPRGPEGPSAQRASTDEDRLIEELTQEKHSLALRVEELEVKVHSLSSSLKRKEREAEVLMDEQQGRLGRYERAAGQCVGELQKAQNRVCSLQAKIRESETRNQKLQERLAEMELELRSAREEAQQQERNVQNLTDAVGSREAEVSELYRVIEEQNKMLSSLRDLQRSGSEAAPGQTEVLALQASLFQAQLELQAGQRAQRQAARAQEVQNRALERLEKDLQGALQHRRETDRHNQELQLVLQKVRSALQENEEQLRQNQQERQREDEEAQRTIKELRTSLQTKEKLVEEYCELLEDPKGTRDSQVLKLRQRITERDRALERAVDEKFRSVEQKEEELHGLQLLLRERDRDLDRQRCVLSNNEETIASLEALLRGKVLELDRVSNAWRTVQRQQQDGEDRQNRILREKDAIVGQLQEVLHARTQEAQELRCSLLPQVHSAPGLVLEELKVRLQLKDRLFQEVLADQTRQAQEHQEQVQDLLRTISCRDQYIQDSTSRLGEVLAEQASRLQELRRQLSSGSGSQPDSGPELQELQELQEELRLALRREQENRAAQLASLSRSLNMKEETIRDLQRQLADPSDLPLVERLTQEVQELREILVQQDAGLVPGRDRDWPNGRQPEFGGGHQRSVGRYL